MYKSISRFMQGSSRLVDPIVGRRKKKENPPEEERRPMLVTFTCAVRQQLGCDLAGEEAFLDEVNGHVRHLVVNGIKHPRAQAEALNKKRIKTALGDQWSLRLLLLFYERMNELRKSRGQAPIKSKANPDANVKPMQPTLRSKKRPRILRPGAGTIILRAESIPPPKTPRKTRPKRLKPKRRPGRAKWLGQ